MTKPKSVYASRFPLRLALLLLVALLMGGCHTAKKLIPPNLRAPTENANALDAARKQLHDATPCCTSYADFSYQTRLPLRPKKFELGPGSSVVSLNGVHSYFLAFELPVDTKLPYRVALKSELHGRWLHNSYLFAPTVTVLDAGFQPVSSKDVPLCEYMGWSSASTGAFGAITIKNPQARYLVIYSSAGQQRGGTYWEQSPAAFSADAPVKMASAGSFSIPHGPDGTLWIGLMDDTYANAVDSGVCGEPKSGNGLLDTLKTAIPLPWLDGSDKKGSR